MVPVPGASARSGALQFTAALGSDSLLVRLGQCLLSGSVEPGTARSYKSGLSKFQCYLLEVSLRLAIPTPSCQSTGELRELISAQGMLEGFVVFCFQQGLGSKTAKNYMDGLKHYASCLDGVPVIPGQRVIDKLLEGFAKMGKQPGPLKLGIDSHLTRCLVAELKNMDLHSYEHSLWRALFSIAFFGCFRVSEFLISSDDLKLLCPDNVIFRDAAEFLLYKTKNNPRGPVQEVIFPALGEDPICPVAALRDFVGRRPSTSGRHPFFVNSRGVPISPKVFNAMLRTVLSRLNFTDTMRYSAKSFRVGASSEAFSLGCAPDEIKGLGRWNSDAFMAYIRSGARAERARKTQVKLAGTRRRRA